jgi:peptidoglycan/LPS O-acetylase OafA/YrhL
MPVLQSIYNFFNSLPQRLSRITSGGKFIKEVDGLRFVAIFPVVLYHLTERFERYVPAGAIGNVRNNPTHVLYHLGILGDFRLSDDHVNPISNFVNMGFIGVYIFFVISGFILAVPFASHKLKGSKPVKLLGYYWRRVTRLEPTYIIWCSILFILFVFAKHTTFGAYMLEYLATITYTHTLFYNIWSPINPVTWTLEIEIQFYILAPFLAAFFFAIKSKALRRTVNTVLLLVLVVVQSWLGWSFEPYNWCILSYLQYFLIGFMLADIYLVDWNTGIHKKLIYDLVAIIAAVAFFFSWSWAFEFANRLLVVISLFVLFYAGFKSIYFNKFLCNRWITAIGGMCYTIYLVHLPLAELFVKVSKHLHITNSYTVNLLVQACLFMPIVFAFSSVAFLLFEKPFMDKNWPQKLVAFFRRDSRANTKVAVEKERVD